MTYTITIPGWHPALKNKWEGRHWGIKHRTKKADAYMVGTYARMAGVPNATGKRRVRLHIVLGKGQRGGDVDAYWKSLLDALKLCGAIKDDSRQWCEIPPVSYSRGKEMATIITLEDIDNERCKSRRKAA